MARAVIVTAPRTAIGTVGRALAQTRAPKLGGIAKSWEAVRLSTAVGVGAQTCFSVGRFRV